jgi:hypothetical protein
MTNIRLPKSDKKAYKKPELTEVRLVAGEAVLGDCKNGIVGHDTCQAYGDINCAPGSSSHS